MSLENKILIKKSFNRLKNYCENEGFKSWDPHDVLNSTLFQKSQLNRVKLFRMGWMEFLNRSPINLRDLLGVEKSYNPKNLSLFLTGYCNLYAIDKKEEYKEKILFLANTLIALQVEGYSGNCWAYSFDYQNSAFFLPKGKPNIVVTSLVASSLLDAYDMVGDHEYLAHAIGTIPFIVNDLNRIKKENGFIFSYSPDDTMEIYSASFLGSKLLSRIYFYTKDKRLLELARASIKAAADAQQYDGSWKYDSSKKNLSKMDTCHMGYNLEAIYLYQIYSGDKSFDEVLSQGVEYYVEYGSQTYSLDIHRAVQFIVTLYRVNRLQEHRVLVEKIVKWIVYNLEDNKEDADYQIQASMAWGFYALTFYFKVFMSNIADINKVQVYSFESKEAFLEEIEGLKKILVAVNAEKIIQENMKLKDIINENIGYPDGIGAVIALKEKGKRSIKIPGSEFWLDIIERYQDEKSFYLIGSTSKVIEQTVKKLKINYPNIKILGYRDGFISEEEKEQLKETLLELKPDVVYVAQGTPRQEFLMDELIKLHPALYMGLGGSFDIYAGDKKRAPKIFLRLNLEWLYRLIKEPTRIGRQLALIRFLFQLKRL